MDADFSVELMADDPSLVFPWADEETGLRHYDLRGDPSLLAFVDEAERFGELREFLKTANCATSEFTTAKCDVWTDAEIAEAEQIYAGSMKFCSYVDLLFADAFVGGPRFSFAAHESLAKRMVELLERAPEMDSAGEFIVRRCYYQENGGAAGFYTTFYLCGYGDDEHEARRRWGVALDTVRNALLQVSAELRRAVTEQ